MRKFGVHNKKLFTYIYIYIYVCVCGGGVYGNDGK